MQPGEPQSWALAYVGYGAFGADRNHGGAQDGVSGSSDGRGLGCAHRGQGLAAALDIGCFADRPDQPLQRRVVHDQRIRHQVVQFDGFDHVEGIGCNGHTVSPSAQKTPDGFWVAPVKKTPRIESCGELFAIK